MKPTGRHLFQLFLLVVFFFALGACSSGNPSISNPSGLTFQSRVNVAVADFVGLATELFGGLELMDCSALESSLQSMAGTEPCEEQGSTQLEIQDIQCQDLAPIEGQADLTFSYQACVQTGVAAQGTIQWTLTFLGNDLTLEFNGGGFAYDGIVYNFQTFDVGSPIEAPQCTGVLAADGNPCGVSQDCSFCPL